MYSVRRRLMIVLAAGFAIVIVGAGLFLARHLEASVTDEYDAALLARVHTFVSLIEEESGRIEFDYTPGVMPEFERDELPDYFQIRLEDGTSVLRSTHLGKDDLPYDAALPRETAIRDGALPDGRRGRIAQLTFRARGPEADDEPEEFLAGAEVPAVTVIIGQGRERLDGLIGKIQLTIFGVGGLALLLAIVLVWRALASGFRPIESIASQVEPMDADNLDARVALPRTPRELAPVVEQLNALLGRMNESFERERRFGANVAHELRTPIAELRSLAEVGKKWPDDPDAVARFFDDVHAIAGRMESVIANLFLLARCQAGVETVAGSPTPLRRVIESTWTKLPTNGHPFHLDVPDDLVALSDEGKLGIIFANLLGNAVTYAPADSEIRCVGTRDGAAFRVDITNDADPLSERELASLAEPFWRKDSARSDAEHAGLGLSVVAALADLLRLDIEFAQEPGGRFRARIQGNLSSA